MVLSRRRRAYFAEFVRVFLSCRVLLPCPFISLPFEAPKWFQMVQDGPKTGSAEARAWAPWRGPDPEKRPRPRLWPWLLEWPCATVTMAVAIAMIAAAMAVFQNTPRGTALLEPPDNSPRGLPSGKHRHQLVYHEIGSLGSWDMLRMCYSQRDAKKQNTEI